MDTFLQDLRFARRTLTRRPGFTIAAVLTLALGIGTNAAMFSIVDAAIFRPLPYRQPDRLMVASLVMPSDPRRPNTSDMVWSFPKYQAFRRDQRVFTSTALMAPTAANLLGDDGAERVTGEIVSAPYFETLGIAASVGRVFAADEDSVAGERMVAVLGHGLWVRRFGADRNVVGRTVRLDGHPFTVVGVIGAGFKGLSGAADYWVPIHTRSAEDLAQPWAHQFTLIARLASGVTPERANAATISLGREIDQLYPNPHGAGEIPQPWGARARPLDETRASPPLRRLLFVLWAAVGCILLIASANVANMQLVRAMARRREIAVRLALGASRTRLIRQLLTESLLLSASGIAVGLLLGQLLLRFLFAFGSNGLASIALRGAGLSASASAVRMDLPVVLTTAAIALAAGIGFGLAPALQAARADLGLATRTADAAGTGRMWTRDALVVSEVALAFVVTIGCVLFLRSLQHLAAVDPGFDPRQVLTARLAIPTAQVSNDSTTVFYDELLRRIKAVPGVESVALADCTPATASCGATFPAYVDRAPPPGFHMPLTGVHFVSADFFRVLHVPLRGGRLFDAQDRGPAPKVIIINETMARQLFPGEAAIGRQLSIGQGGFNVGATVIGIVGDMRYAAMDSTPRPDVFIPLMESPRRGIVTMVRARGRPEGLTRAVTREIGAIQSGLPVYGAATMTDRIAASTSRARVSAQSLALFAALALLLAAVGIYGVLAFIVERRSREIGIRLALGARPAAVVGLIVRRGLWLTAAGGAIGGLGSLALSRTVSGLLFETAAVDATTYLIAALTFGAVALLACWIPAQRAATVDPAVAFRVE